MVHIPWILGYGPLFWVLSKFRQLAAQVRQPLCGARLCGLLRLRDNRRSAGHGSCLLQQGLLFWLFKGGFQVSSSTVSWYRGSHGTDVDISQIASPVQVSKASGRDHGKEPCWLILRALRGSNDTGRR